MLWEVWGPKSASWAAWDEMGGGGLWKCRPASLSLGNCDCGDIYCEEVKMVLVI